jgi:asparagine synthase (glutamine-hydrolysing)
VSAKLDGVLTNARSLKAQLLDRGEAFQTGNDAEIALALFEREGVDAFDRLDGAFALAIYDGEAGELLLTRDRVGRMPLYYHEAKEGLRFASDLRALVRSWPSRLAICTEAVEAFLQLTYIPAPWTIYEGIFKLSAGTFLRVRTQGHGEPQTYWDLDYSEGNQLRDPIRCKELLRDALFASVEDSLHTAGHVRALLSGGIDSTIIAGIAAKVSNQPLDTFTVRFNDRGYDESALAQLSAELHKTRHHVITLEYADVLPRLDEMLRNLDEPYADSSYIPASMVSGAAAGHVETILTGDAGDELFAGYSKYLIGRYSKAFNGFPGWVTRPAIAASNRLLPVHSDLRRKINKVADSARLSPFEQRQQLMSLGFPPGKLEPVLGRPGGERTSALISGYYNKHSDNLDESRQALYLDFKVVLEGDMLPKGYYAGRMNGLRTAVPMLGRGVVEVAAQIPSAYKITNGITKAILKDAFSDFIPPALLKAPKHGFGMPLGAWLRGELRPIVERTLSDARIREQGIVEATEARRLWQEHLDGRADHFSQIWALFVLTKWMEANA